MSIFPASILSSFLRAARCGALGERALPDCAGKGERCVQCTMRNAQWAGTRAERRLGERTKRR